MLMTSGCRLLSSIASTASAATAAAASGRNSGDDRRLLLWLVHGSNQAGLLAMESPQLVRLNHQIPHILVVIFTQHDAKFGWQSAQEEVSEEDVCLLTPWASFQHGGKELHLEQAVHLLVICQLVGIEDPGLEDGVRSEEVRILHHVQDPANAVLSPC